MASRRRTLLKVIILGDSGCAFIISCLYMSQGWGALAFLASAVRALDALIHGQETFICIINRVICWRGQRASIAASPQAQRQHV